MLKTKGILQPLILAFLLSVGFTFVWCGLVVWIENVSTSRHNRGHWERLQFQADGTPMIQTENGYQDLAGKPIDFTDKHSLTGVYLEGSDTSAEENGQAPWDQRLRTFADFAQPANVWYLTCDGRSNGSAYLVGYQIESRARIGFIGTAGFRVDEPPAQERFPFDSGATQSLWHSGIVRRVLSSQDPYGAQVISYYRFAVQATQKGLFAPVSVYVQGNDDRIYEIDLARRAVSVILKNQHVRSMAWMHDPITYDKLTGLAVRTDKAILVLNDRHEIVKTYPLPDLLRDKPLAWGETSLGTALAWTTRGDLLRGETKEDIYWLDNAGRITRHEELTLFGGGAEHLRYVMAAFVPAPALLGGCVAVVWPLTLFSNDRTATWPEAWAKSLDDYWPSLVMASLGGVVLAGVCYRRESRYGGTTKERISWTLFVFAFGLGGWIGYRFGRSWPTLARCPTCGAAVPCDRIECAACQAEFPQPALKGTEVFA